MAGVLLVAAGVHTLAGSRVAARSATAAGHRPVEDGTDDRTDGPAAPRALLVRGGRIAWLGPDPADAPPADRAVDLGAAWVTPSFVDAHVHATASGLAAGGLDLARAASVAECLAQLRTRAAAGGAEVIVGRGWDEFAWPEGRAPSAAEVAEAAPGRTVVLLRVDGHSCVVDPASLGRLPLERLAGVARDRHGRPTGLLREHACQAALIDTRARMAPSQLADARAAACARAAALGVGAFHEMGHPGLSGLDDARAWAAGDWPIEVQVWWAELDVTTGPAYGLRPGGDLFLDGSIGSRSAAVGAPYVDGGGSGELFHDDAEVVAFFSEATAAGLGAGVHAIGDRAIEQALGGLEAAAAAHGADAVRACRHRVEHVELASRDQVRRLARLGVVASVQPAFDDAWGGAERLYAARFGADLALRSNPLAWFAAEGVAMAFGSDSPVTPFDPWGAVVAAERHRGGLGVDRHSALAAHTLGGRRVAGQGDVGALVSGARADLAVWDADPFSVEDPRALTCLATVVSGRCAHGDLPDGR